MQTGQLHLGDWLTPYPAGKPYRVIAAATGSRTIGRGKRRRTEQTSYGYVLWTADTSAEPWREGYGSFCFSGLHRVRAAALSELQKPEVHQVQVRTNQDRTLYVWNKHSNGQITGYRADCED